MISTDNRKLVKEEDQQEDRHHIDNATVISNHEFSLSQRELKKTKESHSNMSSLKINTNINWHKWREINSDQRQ